MFDIFNPIKLFHPQSVNTLIDSDGRRCATTCSDRISCRVLLKLNVLMILHNILFNVIVVPRTALSLLVGPGSDHI